MNARRGRPPRTAPGLTRDAILAAALERVTTPDARLSLRGLAADLGVTAMALYPHIGDLDSLLDTLAAHCLAPDDMPGDLRGLLIWYCDRVLAYPGLTAALFTRHGTLPAPHAAVSDQLAGAVQAAGLDAMWCDILIDHVHGFALAHAAGGTPRQQACDLYARQLDRLLTDTARGP